MRSRTRTSLALPAGPSYLKVMSKTLQSNGYLAGQMLIAMPHMQDPRFARTVVYVCAHSAEGAMGLVINRLFDALSFPDLLKQLDIMPSSECEPIRIHFGGPVESGRGFVLHSGDYCQETTLMVDEHVGLTATVDVLRAIAEGRGPRQSLLALGYAGWSAGQLDEEILDNAWLSIPADDDLLFGASLEFKWERALAKIGADPLLLSAEAGHA